MGSDGGKACKPVGCEDPGYLFARGMHPALVRRDMRTLEPISRNTEKLDDLGDLLQSLDDLLAENAEEMFDEKVTIYCPVGRTAEESEKGRIRLRSILQNLAKERKSETEGTEVDGHISNLLKLTESSEEHWDFWKFQSEGIAIYIDATSARYLKLPFRVEPESCISKVWHLTPLLESAANSGSYWLLHLNQQSVDLYQGSKLGIRKVNVPELIHSFDESEAGARLVKSDDPDAPIPDPEKKDLERYFREVNSAVVGKLEGSTLPLVIAGVDYYLPLYEKANTYAHLHHENVKVTPDSNDLDEVNTKALETLEEVLRESRDSQLETIESLLSRDKAVEGLQDVLEMATQGRIENLVVPTQSDVWGIYDDLENEMTEMDRDESDSRDLYQLAVEKTLAQGGRIFYAPIDDICAELRY